MSFTYNSNEPARNSNPSVSQPIMQQNALSTSEILAVDHITFNAAQGGTHKQVTFASNNPALVAPMNPAASVYTDTPMGSASAHSQLFYRNSEAPFMLNCVKAFGSFSGGASPTLNNSFNVVSVTYSSGSYTVTLNATCTVGSDVCVLTGVNFPGSILLITYSYTNPVLTLTIRSSAGFPNSVSFAVLQF